MWSSFLLTSLAIGVGPFGSPANASPTADAPLDIIIIKDVAIIGGGVTGTYAAVRLRKDFKKSVVVVECEDHLGGHTNTYVVPGTNVSLE
jgi:heterodisulfide reductase subunit A-like polyferredoxin